MTRNSEPMYWITNKLWYGVDEKTDKFYLTEYAPERAIKSFEMYKEINSKTKKHPV